MHGVSFGCAWGCLWALVSLKPYCSIRSWMRYCRCCAHERPFSTELQRKLVTGHDVHYAGS